MKSKKLDQRKDVSHRLPYFEKAGNCYIFCGRNLHAQEIREGDKARKRQQKVKCTRECAMLINFGN